MNIRTITLLFFLLFIFFTISVTSSLKESLTFDEPVHVLEGKNALLHHTFAIDTNNPPFSREFAALPIVFHMDTFIQSSLPFMKILPARLMTVLLAVALAIAVFFTSRAYFSLTAAFIALFILIFDPNILANDHYVTLDMGFTLLFFLSYILLLNILDDRKDQKSLDKSSSWNTRFFSHTEIRKYVLLAVTVGLGLSSKISFIPFFFLSALLLLGIKKGKNSFSFLLGQRYYILLTIIFSVVVLWATYFFRTDVIIAQRADTGRVSYRLEQFAKKHHIPFLSSILEIAEHQPVPLGNYLAMIKNNTIRNTIANNYFFLGRPYAKHQWYFLPINVLLKTPIPLMIFLLTSLFAVFINGLHQKKNLTINKQTTSVSQQLIKRITLSKEGETTLTFFIPVMAILFISSATNMNPFVRYVLPMFPFTSIVASQGVVFLTKKPYGSILVVVLLCWYLLSTLSYFPHFISYSNELLGVNTKKDVLFIDSDMDWGESLPDVKQYIDAKKPKTLYFSYFATDNPSLYGLKSTTPFRSNKFAYLCAFHTVPLAKTGHALTAMSLTGWYDCGYYKKPQYAKGKIKDIVGKSILIF